jgi:dipeptidyl aminopeptidase/acylaminoacyl peptidase
MSRRQGLALLALALAVALAPEPAGATAPGRNGRIAYVSEPAFDGAFVESVLPAGGGSKRLSARLPHGSYGPAFAPDGARIALTVLKANIRRVEILRAGKLREIARGRSPAWSPDGRWIAFLSGQKVGSGIFLIHPDGTGLHAIGNRHLELGANPPAWSPDGRTLVYTRQTANGQQLWAIGMDGTHARALVRVRSAGQPSFAPDGRHIAFTAFDARSRSGIWVAAADGSGARALHVAPGERTLFRFPVYSPDGRSIAFLLQGSRQQIAVMRAADGGGRRIVSPATSFIGGVDWARAA